MREVINYIVFGWYPYLCLTVFLIGSWVRFDREQYTWKTGSSQLLRRRQLMWGSNLFHFGILVIFLGHFVGLLMPIRVFDALGISHTFKQWMAIVIGGVAGIVCLVGITLLVHRRLLDPRIRRTSMPPPEPRLPPVPAVLFDTVELFSVITPSTPAGESVFMMPPPSLAAEFRVTNTPLSVAVPTLRIPPPYSAVLSDTVVLLITNTPRTFKIPPPFFPAPC